ncbi:MAG: alkaline phosphatase [Bacteroidales bacterium]|nr:MAG: alkaline phosphatase [Bacteroidales bacterium]
MKTYYHPASILFAVLLVFSSFISDSDQNNNKKQAKNIILMIGDGMGVSQIYAGMTANHGHLNLERCENTGFIKTYSASHYITESAAGATAISTGKKTYNGACGVNTDTLPEKTILEIAEDNGLATGLISTSSITHATPASFIAHQKRRHMYEEIAEDFLKTDIDVFIGGGRKHFIKRSDGVDLVLKLKEKGYKVLFEMDSVIKVDSGKLAGLVADMHLPPYRNRKKSRRGDMLPDATQSAINILSKNKKGFFLMVEGSQIDWAGHANKSEYVIAEMLDFDRAIGKALDFAEKDGNTLVIITADHETGGMSINAGNFKEGTVDADFNTRSHTGVMVPVFAYGPGSELFSGIYENIDIFYKMMTTFGFESK